MADAAGLSVALLANSTYEFEAVLALNSSSTAGLQLGVQFSAAGAAIEATALGSTSGVTASTWARVNAFNSAIAAMVTVNGAGQAVIKGRVTVGVNAGNLTIQHLKVTSGTSTIRQGSFLKAWKVA